jgi:hypothetical protein
VNDSGSSFEENHQIRDGLVPCIGELHVEGRKITNSELRGGRIGIDTQGDLGFLDQRRDHRVLLDTGSPGRFKDHTCVHFAGRFGDQLDIERLSGPEDADIPRHAVAGPTGRLGSDTLDVHSVWNRGG